MYKTRINAWKLHKNLKKKEKDNLVKNLKKVDENYLARKVPQTCIGHPIVFKGRPVQPHKLIRYCKDNNLPLPANLQKASFPSQGCGGKSAPQTNSWPNSIANDLRRLFAPPTSPQPSVALYGDVKTTETILWNVEIYLKNYFDSGLGTYYFEVVPAPKNREEAIGKSARLVLNKEALLNSLDPSNIYVGIMNVGYEMNVGLIKPAFRTLDEVLDQVHGLLQEEAPGLLPYLLIVLIEHGRCSTNLDRQTTQFILRMANQVLGDTHSITVILNLIGMLGSLGDQCFVWRAVLEVFGKHFQDLEVSELFYRPSQAYLELLQRADMLEEGIIYMETLYAHRGQTKFAQIDYFVDYGYLLRRKGRNREAEAHFRRCVELCKEVESDILAGQLLDHDRQLIRIQNQMCYCRSRLADILEDKGRTDEAIVLWRQAVESSLAQWSYDPVACQIDVALFEDILTRHEYTVELAALREHFPFLLDRRKIPKEMM
jgi:tetratricopeptide (TPR) repeat protein